MGSLAFVSVAIVAGVDAATALEERSGQAMAAQADTFPVEIKDQEYLEALGFKFLGPIEDDPLFQRVEMPEGWKKVPAEHPMWTELVDPQGRKRGRIFANRLDQRAFFTGLARVFTVGDGWKGYEDPTTKKRTDSYAGEVSMHGKLIHTTVRVTLAPEEGKTPNPEDYSKISEMVRQHAIVWLVTTWPDWENPLAYWD